MRHTAPAWRRQFMRHLTVASANELSPVHSLNLPSALSGGQEAKQLAKLLDSACASWGTRSTAAHMELMLANMHCHTAAPSAASMQRLAWLAAHRPVDEHSSVWSAALLLLGTARCVLAQPTQPMTPAAVRSVLAAVQISLKQAGSPAAGVALPSAATLSLLGSCAALGNSLQLLPPSAPVVQSPWAQQAIQDTCSHALRFALRCPETASNPASQVPPHTDCTRMLAHSVAGNHGRATALAAEMLQAHPSVASALAASVATCVLLRPHFGSAAAAADCSRSAAQAAHIYWTEALSNYAEVDTPHMHAVCWATLHAALLLPPDEGRDLLSMLPAAQGGVPHAGLGQQQVWELQLRHSVVCGLAPPPLLPRGLHVSTRAVAAWLALRGGAGAVARHVWPDPLLGLQVQLGGVSVDTGAVEGGWAPEGVWAQRWLGSMPPGQGVQWPPVDAPQPTEQPGRPLPAKDATSPVLGGGVGSGAAAALSSWQFDMWLGFGDAGELLVQAAQRVAKRMSPQPAAPSGVQTGLNLTEGVQHATPDASAAWDALLKAARGGQLPPGAAEGITTLAQSGECDR